MQPDPQPVALPQPLAVLRRYWWQAIAVTVFGALGLAALLLGRPWPGVAWLACSVTLVACEWLNSRLGTPLGKATAADLLDVLETRPLRTTLLDRETDDVFWITRRRPLGMRAWQVACIPDAAAVQQEVEEDFAAGRLSTIPRLSYQIGAGRIGVLDTVTPVQVGDGGRPEPYAPPGPAGHLRGMLLRVRTGSMRVTDTEVSNLLTKLRRAEPIQDEPEEEVHDHAV